MIGFKPTDTAKVSGLSQPSHTTVHTGLVYGGSPNSTTALCTGFTLLFSTQVDNERTGIGHPIILSDLNLTSRSLTFSPSVLVRPPTFLLRGLSSFQVPTMTCSTAKAKASAARGMMTSQTQVLEFTGQPTRQRLLPLNVCWTSTFRVRS